MTESSDTWSGDGLLAQLILSYARRAPSHPSKIRLFRALASRLFPNGIPLRSKADVRLNVDPSDYIGHSICFTGSFEPLSLSLATRLMRAGGTFIDVGANLGLFTCSVAALPGVECLAVDASAVAFSKLQLNMAKNCAKNVHAANLALGSERGIANIQIRSPGNLGTTHVVAPERIRVPGSHSVAVVTLEELLTALHVGRITLMKIDVEGYELEVFRGLDLAGPHRPLNIIMEYCERVGWKDGDLMQCVALLKSHGYVPCTVTGAEFHPTRQPPEENLWWRTL